MNIQKTTKRDGSLSKPVARVEKIVEDLYAYQGKGTPPPPAPTPTYITIQEAAQMAEREPGKINK